MSSMNFILDFNSWLLVKMKFRNLALAQRKQHFEDKRIIIIVNTIHGSNYQIQNNHYHRVF